LCFSPAASCEPSSRLPWFPRPRIYILGEGFIEAWQGTDPDHYGRLGRYATPGDARTGLFVPDLGELFEAVPHHGQQGAEVLVYATK
jgi:hypothetical protein